MQKYLIFPHLLSTFQPQKTQNLDFNIIGLYLFALLTRIDCEANILLEFFLKRSNWGMRPWQDCRDFRVTRNRRRTTRLRPSSSSIQNPVYILK